MKPSCAAEIYTNKISPNFFVHIIPEDLNVCWKNILQSSNQCITFYQRMSRYQFVYSIAQIMGTFFSDFTLVTFFMLHFSRKKLELINLNTVIIIYSKL